MTVEPPESRFRPAVVGPVLVAAIFLAVIGASVGFVLGGRDGGNGDGTAGGPSTPASTAPDTPSDEQPGTQPPPPPPPQDNDPPPTRDRCPRQTERLARQAGSPGGLQLKLYIRTNGSEVWICQDSGGTLFYQGHRGQPGQRLIEGQNALFLTDVVAEGEGYLATNRSGDRVTTYRVSTSQLVIDSRNGTTTEDVRDHWP